LHKGFGIRPFFSAGINLFLLTAVQKILIGL